MCEEEDSKMDADERLLQAVQEGDTAKVRQLLEAGANANARTQVEMGGPAAKQMKAMGFRGDRFDCPAFLLALWNRRTDIASLLLSSGADINAKLTVASLPPKWRRASAFSMALAYHRDDIAGFLVENGLDVNERDPHGWTALMEAAWHGKAELVRLLAEKGADTAAADDDGDTALELARKAKHSEVVAILSRARK
jgi:ankyrin repeat protein